MRLLLALALLVACNRPQYTYEPRPPSPDAASECHRAGDVAIATGRFSWTRNLGSQTLVSRDAAGNTSINYGPAQQESYGDTGVILYRGSQRFSALAGLEAVGAKEAARAQREVLAETRGAHGLVPVMQTTSVILAGGGTVALAIGGALVLSDPSAESNTPAYVMLGGVAALAVSLVPAVIAFVKLPDRVRHQRDQRLIVYPAIARAAAEAAQTHNRRVAEGCRDGAAATPMTERARSLLSR